MGWDGSRGVCKACVPDGGFGMQAASAVSGGVMARVPAVGEDHARPPSSGVCRPSPSSEGLGGGDAGLEEDLRKARECGCDVGISFPAHAVSSSFTAVAAPVWFGRLVVAPEVSEALVPSSVRWVVSGPAGQVHLCWQTSSKLELGSSPCCCLKGRPSLSTRPFVVPQSWQGLSVHELHGVPRSLSVLSTAAPFRSTVVVAQGLESAEGSVLQRERGFLSAASEVTMGLTSASSAWEEVQGGVWGRLVHRCFMMLHCSEMTPWSH